VTHLYLRFFAFVRHSGECRNPEPMRGITNGNSIPSYNSDKTQKSKKQNLWIPAFTGITAVKPDSYF